jgi:hypothetical protein
MTTPKSEDEIQELEKRLEDLKRRLPAYSIPPGMIAEMDDLEERLEAARARQTARKEPGE